ncbi:MAG: type II CRISPR-associated endonuclease Cas1 [Bacteroidales bacterium]|nr:type II CRISPR-associated endonuclease Cas1 [Bacteroidales bacterium]
MIKKTLCISNPASLRLKNQQMEISLSQSKSKPSRYPLFQEDFHSIPIEDIGVLVLESREITVTTALMSALLENNCAIITCDQNHMPLGLQLPLRGNTVYSERFQAQLSSSLPLRKQLWQQTIQNKIRNQAAVLKFVTGQEVKNMLLWSSNVRSGDPDNLEARAATFYWKNIFSSLPGFIRGRDEDPPNNLLNYGYAILRAVIARSLVGSGLLPVLGIHHHNRYNPYCLADDIMEPYRPYVDRMVAEYLPLDDGEFELTPSLKRMFLQIPALSVNIAGEKSPLMIAATTTTASLAKCFTGEQRKLIYPEIEI